MQAFFSFASNNPFTAWLLEWGLWPICWTVRSVLTTPFKCAASAYRRKLRSRDIQAHGWPKQPFMDADGDYAFPREKTNGS